MITSSPIRLLSAQHRYGGKRQASAAGALPLTRSREVVATGSIARSGCRGVDSLREHALGVGRDRLVVGGDQVPRGVRFPGGDPHDILEGAHREALLNRVQN